MQRYNKRLLKQNISDQIELAEKGRAVAVVPQLRPVETTGIRVH